MTTEELLEQYTEYRTAYELESAEMERQRAAIMAQIQDQLDSLSAEFKPRLDAASEKFAELENEIKKQVLADSKSLKGRRWQFVYAKGRVTWDGKKLDGMASIIPELKDAMKVGEPTVSIREVK